MLEFEKTLKDYDKYLKLSKRGFSNGWNSYHSAEKRYNKAAKIREEILQNVLDERGLAICSEFHFIDKDEVKKMKNITAEQLGIYPREQLRLLYKVYGPYTIQGEYEDSGGMDRKLDLLCPEHFPNTGWINRQKEGELTYILSEVIKKDGKFILTVDGTDITEKVNKGGPDFYPNGLRPNLVDRTVFRYFGIPDLPKKPDVNSVRY